MNSFYLEFSSSFFRFGFLFFRCFFLVLKVFISLFFVFFVSFLRKERGGGVFLSCISLTSFFFDFDVGECV